MDWVVVHADDLAGVADGDAFASIADNCCQSRLVSNENDPYVLIPRCEGALDDLMRRIVAPHGVDRYEWHGRLRRRSDLAPVVRTARVASAMRRMRCVAL
jgi:hypothetical protein